MGILLVGTAVSDMGAQYNQGRSGGFSPGLLEGLRDGVDVIAVIDPYDLPFVGSETGGDIFGKRKLGSALDRYLIIVIDTDQFAQTQMAGQ